MRFLLKILVAPVVAVLAIITWLFAFILNLSAYVFGICGIIIIFTTSVTNGIIVLVIAFLVSPFGFPMLATWLLGQIQRLRYAIQDKVYG